MRLLAFFLLTVALGGSEGRRRESGRERLNMLETNKVPVGRAEESEPCDDCKRVVEKLNQVLDDPTKLSELKLLLNMLCDSMPSSYRDECKEVVSNLDRIAEELKPLLQNPERFCRSIHLCGSGRRAAVIRTFLLFVDKYVSQAADPLRANDVLCDECQFAMNELKQLLADPSIQTDIEDELKNICSLLGSLKDECDSLVEQYVPALLDQLEQLLSNPKEVCTELGLCASQRMAIPGFPLSRPHSQGRTPNRRVERFRFMMSRLHTEEGMNVGCVLCKLSITTIVDAIKDDKTIVRGIVDGMKKICDIFPSQMIKPGCLDFLSIYAEPVIMLTLDEISSQQLCQDFHLCSPHELRELKKNENNQAWKDEVVCDACKTLTGFLRYECRQPSFQKAVADDLKHVCDVAGRFSQQCDNMVDQYVPYLIQMLAQFLESDALCIDIRLCKAGAALERH